MAEGSKAGQIATLEANAIAGGTIVDVVEQHPLGDAPDSAPAGEYLDARWTQLATEAVASLVKRLSYYGGTR